MTLIQMRHLKFVVLVRLVNTVFVSTLDRRSIKQRSLASIPITSVQENTRRGVLILRCSENTLPIYRRTTVSKCDF